MHSFDAEVNTYLTPYDTLVCLSTNASATVYVHVGELKVKRG